MKDRSNVILLGAGSKVLCNNAGWVACEDPAVFTYMTYMSPTFIFSNAISPITAATCSYIVKLASGDEGKKLRK